MKFNRSVLSLVLVFSLITGYATLDAREKPTTADINILTLDKLKPGMKGTGRSVFQGTQVEEFNVEILGITGQTSPRKNIIIAKLSGGPLEKTGVIAGMSGSPIYIDDKLIGAVAYAWAFAKEPIAGITPIQEMLPLLDMDLGIPETLDLIATGNDESSSSASQNRFQLLPSLVPGIFSPEIQQNTSPYSWEDFKLLGLPLMVSGSRSPSLSSAWRENLASTGFMLVENTGGGNTSPEIHTLVPGSPLGVQLVGGDMNLSAMGTLTAIVRDRIIAFGHPMFLGGHIDLPMTAGYISAVMPSQFVSFKIGIATDIIGSLRQDRSAGVAGVVGPAPFMIPFTLSLLDEDSGEGDVFNFKIARVPGLTAMLLYISISDTIESYNKGRGHFYAKLAWDIELEGLPRITCNDFVSGTSGILTSSAKHLASQIYELEYNPFQSVNIKSIRLDAQVGEHVHRVKLESARLSKTSYVPGDDMSVYLTYRPYKKQLKKFETQIHIPEDIVPGIYTLTISDASIALMNDLKRAPVLHQTDSIQELIAKLNNSYAQNQLVLEIWGRKPSLAIQGTEFSRIPGSVFDVLDTMPQSGMGTKLKKSLLLRKVIDANYHISGFEMISFRIKPNQLSGR